MQLFNSVYIRSSLVCFFFIIANFHSSPDLETKISTDFTTGCIFATVFPLENTNKFWNSFQTSQECTQGLLILDCRLLVTITFCLIQFRLLFYNMHAHISWCYSSFFVNTSCQICSQIVCLFVFYFHSRFLLLSRLVCCYSLVVICCYKKTSKNQGYN